MKNFINGKSKRIVSLLLLLSLVLTTGSFAYWASYIEGTSNEVTDVLTVGSSKKVSTIFEISNELVSGGLLVPAVQVENSLFGAVDHIDLIYNLSWAEESDTTQLSGANTLGKLDIQHEVLIEKNNEFLDQSLFSNINELINVSYSELNPETLQLNGSSELFSFIVTMEEPKNQFDYNVIIDAKIFIIFTYVILDNNIDVIDISNNNNIIQETDVIYFTSVKNRIKSYDTTGGSEIVIPQVINDIEILEIGHSCFHSDGLTSVIIQEGITTIGGNAFHSNNLSTISIPASVIEISYNAFNGNQLQSVLFEEGITTIKAGAFSNNQITSLTLPDSLTFVGSGAFGYGSNFITEITIGNDVTIQNNTSFGWHGKSFKAIYDVSKEAGTYIYINGVWEIQ